MYGIDILQLYENKYTGWSSSDDILLLYLEILR